MININDLADAYILVKRNYFCLKNYLIRKRCCKPFILFNVFYFVFGRVITRRIKRISGRRSWIQSSRSHVILTIISTTFKCNLIRFSTRYYTIANISITITVGKVNYYTTLLVNSRPYITHTRTETRN